jgi:hypothetical protein
MLEVHREKANDLASHEKLKGTAGVAGCGPNRPLKRRVKLAARGRVEPDFRLASQIAPRYKV